MQSTACDHSTEGCTLDVIGLKKHFSLHCMFECIDVWFMIYCCHCLMSFFKSDHQLTCICNCFWLLSLSCVGDPVLLLAACVKFATSYSHHVCIDDNNADSAALFNSVWDTSSKCEPVGLFLCPRMYAAPSRSLRSWVPFFQSSGMCL